MSDFPLSSVQRFQSAGASGARGVVVTANASANTKGTYAELIAATAFDSCGILVQIDRQGVNGDALVDIAIGAAGSEVVKIPNLMCHFQTNRFQQPPYFVPISIPAGTRIAAAMQATTGAQAISVSAILLAKGFAQPSGYSRVTPYGVNTADSGAVSIDPGGTANTKPSTFTEITSATTYQMKWMIVAFGGNADSARATSNWFVDVAVGASTSEVVKVPDLSIACSVNTDVVGPANIGFPCDIPAGTRLSARAACDITTAGDRLFDIAIYGID